MYVSVVDINKGEKETEKRKRRKERRKEGRKESTETTDRTDTAEPTEPRDVDLTSAAGKDITSLPLRNRFTQKQKQRQEET